VGPEQPDYTMMHDELHWQPKLTADEAYIMRVVSLLRFLLYGCMHIKCVLCNQLELFICHRTDEEAAEALSRWDEWYVPERRICDSQ